MKLHRTVISFYFHRSYSFKLYYANIIKTIATYRDRWAWKQVTGATSCLLMTLTEQDLSALCSVSVRHKL